MTLNICSDVENRQTRTVSNNYRSSLVYREVGFPRGALLFTAPENRIGLKFRLMLEQGREPFSQWMDGIAEDFSHTGARFRTKLPEETIETLTTKYVTISLKLTLPGADTAITADASLKYFKKGSISQEGTTIDLGVEFIILNDLEQTAISEFLRKEDLGRSPRLFDIAF